MNKTIWRGLPAVALLSVGALAAVGQAVGSLPEKPAATKQLEFRNLVYETASGKKLELDVFLNPKATAGAPAPVLVYFHGGAWARGERNKKYAGFNSFYAMGFSVVSVDYRLTGTATAPAAVTDALCSLSWVRANARQYNFDPTRVVPYGTSAGAHIALMAGMLPADTDVANPACGPLPKVVAILDFYGPTDLAPGLKLAHPNHTLVSWIGPVSDPTAMAQKMSPMTYVKSGQPPVFLVQGDKDPVVPYAQSVELQKALEEAKVPNFFYTVAGGSHGGFTKEQKQVIFGLVRDFLVKQKIVPFQKLPKETEGDGPVE
jgi:acetyl esterase/lipase